MRCGKGREVVKYGEYIEVVSLETGEIVAAFKVVRDMCEEMFKTYLVVRHGVETPYKIKRVRGKR